MHAANPSSVSNRRRQAQPLDMTQAEPSLCSEPSGARVMRLVSGPPDFAKPVISIWLRFMPVARRARAAALTKAGLASQAPAQRVAETPRHRRSA